MRKVIWLILLLVAVGWGRRVDALTIYRIGGADLPPPERDKLFEFVQLAWSAVDATAHGSVLLAETEAALTPQQLDPSVNLAPLLDARGGKIETLRSIVGWADFPARDAPMFDGDPGTHFLGDGDWGGDYGAIENKVLVFDLGGLFNIDRVRFYPRKKHLVDRFIENFVVGVNDGDPFKDGTREYLVGEDWRRRPPGARKDFEIAMQGTENTRSDIVVEINQAIRNILFEAPANVRGAWEIAEFEIYGSGFTPNASYTSNVIDLGQASSLGRLEWSAEVSEGAVVELTMRSGDDSDPNTYWRKTFRGDETTRYGTEGKALVLSTYNRLDKGERAGITPDTENWQSWSSPYDLDLGGGRLEGSKPRQFVQFAADFSSTVQAGGRLDYLQFEVSDPPVASQALAEIVPVRVAAGEVTSFTYKLLPRFADIDLGFDTIEIETPVRVVSIDQVRLDGEPVDFSQVHVDENGFELRIPRMTLQRTGELLEVDFQVEVFKFGTVFTGRIFDSEKPFEVRQTLTPGDADPMADSNTLSVGLVEVQDKAVNALKLTSSVLTPNGDGINDALAIEYELLNLFGSVPVVLDLYDLSGRRVGSVYRGTAASGRFSLAWDGRLGAGSTPAPGMYLLRLEVDSDHGKEALQRVISLAY